MTAANILGRAGHRVLVLEQHYNFGGMATCFKRRGGHNFDISLHGFPAGMIKTCRKYWSPKVAGNIVKLDGVRFDNPQFQFETEFTRNDFTDKLVNVLGCDRKNVEGFYDTLRRMNYYDDDGRTTGELFEDYFPGRNDVHRLLMEPISYANGSSMEDPAISYGIVFSNFMAKGVYTFVGGTDGLIRDMRECLDAGGVDLFGRCHVDQILVDKGRVRGVRVGEREIKAGVVISNANVLTTMQKLVGEEHFSADFAKGAREVRLNTSSCQVYLGLHEGQSVPWMGDLFFTSTRPTFDSAALCDLHGESRTYSFYYPKSRPGSNHYSIVSSTNALFEDWADLTPEAYAKNKQRLEQETLDALAGYLPDIREKVHHVESSTPLSFQFYTDAPEGTSFGTKFEGLAFSMGLPEQIEGLYHAGSVGIIMSGWLGAANYGAICAHKVDTHLASLLPDSI